MPSSSTSRPSRVRHRPGFFKKDNSGSTAIEYALIAAIAAISAITALQAFGDSASSMYDTIGEEIVGALTS